MCQALNAAGEPCGATPLRAEPYCFFHSKRKAEERRQAQVRGGFRSQGTDPDREIPSVRLRTVPDLLSLLEVAAQDVLRARPSLARARTVGYLASVTARILELGPLETRVARLESTARERWVMGLTDGELVEKAEEILTRMRLAKEPDEATTLGQAPADPLRADGKSVERG